jgi:hypothetical protein
MIFSLQIIEADYRIRKELTLGQTIRFCEICNTDPIHQLSSINSVFGVLSIRQSNANLLFLSLISQGRRQKVSSFRHSFRRLGSAKAVLRCARSRIGAFDQRGTCGCRRKHAHCISVEGSGPKIAEAASPIEPGLYLNFAASIVSDRRFWRMTCAGKNAIIAQSSGARDGRERGIA